MKLCCQFQGDPPQSLPFNVSLSLIRKAPGLFPGARSCLSASLRVMSLKNHLKSISKGQQRVPSPPTKDTPRQGKELGSISSLENLLFCFQSVYFCYIVAGNEAFLPGCERFCSPPFSLPEKAETTKVFTEKEDDQHCCLGPPVLRALGALEREAESFPEPPEMQWAASDQSSVMLLWAQTQRIVLVG